MKKYLSNAFSLQMLDLCQQQKVNIQPVTVEYAANFAKSAENCVGHADTASVFSKMLENKDFTYNRVSIRLEKGDKVLVGQVTGGRLPEGAKELPEGVSIQWVLVKIS